jgi:hypothetical protein
MGPETWWTHVEIIAGILIPLGSGLIYVVYQLGQVNVKVTTMWEWYTNHGSSITGYKKNEEDK